MAPGVAFIVNSLHLPHVTLVPLSWYSLRIQGKERRQLLPLSRNMGSIQQGHLQLPTE